MAKPFVISPIGIGHFCFSAFLFPSPTRCPQKHIFAYLTMKPPKDLALASTS